VGKAPADQFYWRDWAHDLEEHPLKIEGAWIRICCKLWYSETRGSLTKSPIQWARILRVGKKQAMAVLEYIKTEKIGDVTFCNPKVTVACRRMVRDEKKRKANRDKVARHREKQKPKCNHDVTASRARLSSSSSSSSSSSTSKNKDIYSGFCAQVLDYLNEKTGKKYRRTDEIEARLRDGGTLEECKTIIDNKLRDPHFQENPKYLAPTTLFRKSHWDKYLNDTPDPLQGKVSDVSQRTIRNLENMRLE